MPKTSEKVKNKGKRERQTMNEKVKEKEKLKKMGKLMRKRQNDKCEKKGKRCLKEEKAS